MLTILGIGVVGRQWLGMTDIGKIVLGKQNTLKYVRIYCAGPFLLKGTLTITFVLRSVCHWKF